MIIMNMKAMVTPCSNLGVSDSSAKVKINFGLLPQINTIRIKRIIKE